MAILVTGGAGFIGSHVTDSLVENGYEVIVADNLSSGNIKNLNPKANFYNIDLKNPNEIEIIFLDNNIEYVCHLAAQVSVSFSMKNVLNDAEQNIINSINLFNLCKKHSTKKIIAVSTAAVYGFPQYLPVDEKHQVDLLSFYGLSKYTMENYIKLFGINYIILRFANVYGPRQDANGEAGVVSIFVDRILDTKPIEIHGDGEQTRDFVYVKDAANAVVLAIKSEVNNEIINISSNTSISVNELFNRIKNNTNSQIDPSYIDQRPGDIKDSVLNNAKAKQLLIWNNNISIEEGLCDTIQWKRCLVK